MKFIEKQEEPVEFIQWKQEQQQAGVNCKYSCLQKPQKQTVHESLLQEQGFICCYCCKRINKDSSHIEHFTPQSKTDDELSISYKNLHASCGNPQYWPQCCGNHRQNSEIPVSPLDEDCELYFTYTSDGKIMTVENHPRQQDAEVTIQVLNLNFYDLIKSREEAFDTLIDLSDDEANSLIKKCYEKDNNEMFLPFCTAVADFIRQYYNVA